MDYKKIESSYFDNTEFLSNEQNNKKWGFMMLKSMKMFDFTFFLEFFQDNWWLE